MRVYILGASGESCISMALSFSYYFSEVQRKKTCLIEFCPDRKKSVMDVLLTDRISVNRETIGFIRNGVEIFPGIDIEETVRIAESGFERSVILMECVSKEIISSAERGNLKIIVGSLRSWKKKEFFEFIREWRYKNEMLRGFRCFAANSNELERDEFERKTGLAIYNYPEINPDCMMDSDRLWLRDTLKKEAGTKNKCRGLKKNVRTGNKRTRIKTDRRIKK